MGLGNLKMVESKNTPPVRKIFLNNQQKNHKQSTNEITTAKYPGLKIIYKPLIEFFCIVANIYFLIISILQLFTNLSPESSRIVTAVPLLIIFLVSLIRKGLEDWHRKKADREQNYASAYVLDPNSETLTQKPCKELKIGDIIKVSYQQPVPADLLLLATSESEGNCSVETSNLDGETNLKRKEVHKLLAEIIGYRKSDASKPVDEKVLISSLLNLQGTLEYEGSTNNLYSFSAKININEKTISLNLDHVIWRCCSLKNCDYVYGLVIYIGNDTRAMKNTRDPPLKQSLLYEKSNWLIIIVFILEIVIIILSTIFSFLFYNNADEHWYLNIGSNSGSWTIIFTFLILYNNFVPISLYVSLDFVKYFQARLMENDQNMFDEENGIPMMVRTAEICENLGQIDYIFTDKTGTLTRNIMELKKFFTGNMSYGFLDDEIIRNHYRLCTRENTHFILDKTVSFRDPKYKEDIVNQNDEQGKILYDFMKCLALCHTVVPEFKESKIGYRASSPDEEAFVKAARALGFSVFVRGKSVSIEVTNSKKNSTLHYEILCTNQFDSNRRRMSVIIKDYNDNERIWLLCKGADSDIIPFLSKDSIDNDLEKINTYNKSFASMGLRTLVFTKRELNENEFENWMKEFEEANNSLVDRICRLSDVAGKIEKDLNFVGITAIEDRLQEGVPECIENLSIAGIKIWLITGDKIETAINVAQSCNLLQPTMRYYVISELRAEDIRKQICEIEAYIKHKKSTEQYGIVIGGGSLSLIIKNARASGRALKQPELSLQSRYLNCCKNARCVIACRVSPTQKAQLVDLVRFGLPNHPITLGIGDGANDVNMIQSSHVGVGIIGKEGLQAVNNSDFAISQFRFLNHLLLVYGKDIYRRVCGVILYSFYKNIALVLTIFFFQFFTGQSGATFYDSILKLSYNFFLAIPIIVFGSIDSQCKPRTSIKYPQLYKFGRKGKGLCVRELLLWMLEAILHGAVPFIGGYFLMETIWGDDGQMDGISLYGTGVYTAVFIIMNVKMAYMNHIWNWCFQLSYWGSIVLYFVFATIYSASVSSGEVYYLASVKIWTRPRFYLMVLIIVSTSMLIDYTVLMWRRLFKPFPIEICQEYDRKMKLKKIESRRSTLESELLDI